MRKYGIHGTYIQDDKSYSAVKNNIFLYFLFKYLRDLSLTDDDYDMFYEMWQKYDPNCIEFIPYTQLFDFVRNLGKPLGIPRPNRLKIISLNLTVCESDMVHCSDILGLFYI